MKKMLSLILSMVFCLSFCACGDVETELSPELEREIQEAYYHLPDEPIGFSPEDVRVDGYGTYGEATVVMIYPPHLEYAAVETVQTVGEYEFRYPSLHCLEVYYHGSFFTLLQAYETGFLSEGHLNVLYETYRSRNLSLYGESDVSSAVSKSDTDPSLFTDGGLQWMEKVYCTATENDDFAVDKVILLLNGEKQYTASDFADVGCVSLEEWTESGEPIVELTLNTDSKQDVLDAIRQLEGRDDVIASDPAYTVPVPLSRTTVEDGKLLEEINSVSGVETSFTIEKRMGLKSITYPEGYYYVLCDLAPHGWAVLTEDGRVMMGQFHGGNPPELDENTDYYYVGINSFAVEKDGCLYLPDSETPLSRRGLQRMMAIEARGVLSCDGWSIRAESFDDLPVPFAPAE